MINHSGNYIRKEHFQSSFSSPLPNRPCRFWCLTLWLGCSRCLYKSLSCCCCWVRRCHGDLYYWAGPVSAWSKVREDMLTCSCSHHDTTPQTTIDSDFCELLSKTIITLKYIRNKKDTNGANVNPGPLTCQYNTEMHKYTQTHYKYRGQRHRCALETSTHSFGDWQWCFFKRECTLQRWKPNQKSKEIRHSMI